MLRNPDYLVLDEATANLDPVTEKNKVPARSYNLDADQYVAFLEKGLE